LQISRRISDLTISGQVVDVQAGKWVPILARQLMLAGLTGAEHICGIPRTLGGLIYMNGGSQRNNLDSCIVSVESVDFMGKFITRKADSLEFSYRSSIFQKNNEVSSVRL